MIDDVDENVEKLSNHNKCRRDWNKGQKAGPFQTCMYQIVLS